MRFSKVDRLRQNSCFEFLFRNIFVIPLFCEICNLEQTKVKKHTTKTKSTQEKWLATTTTTTTTTTNNNTGATSKMSSLRYVFCLKQLDFLLVKKEKKNVA